MGAGILSGNIDTGLRGNPANPGFLVQKNRLTCSVDAGLRNTVSQYCVKVDAGLKCCLGSYSCMFTTTGILKTKHLETQCMKQKVFVFT